jgi:hypothetical protein
MEKKKLVDICHHALEDFNLQSRAADYPLNIILKGPLKEIKSFQMVLFLMECESALEEGEMEVDLFDLFECMDDNVTVEDLIHELSII